MLQNWDMSTLLALGEASEYLGVHPSTLRTWAIQGRIVAVRTPGGHRRFRREDVEHLKTAFRLDPEPKDESAVAAQALATMPAPAQAWSQGLTLPEREEHRVLGHKLLNLAIRYILRAHGHEAMLEEARHLGSQYGYTAKASNLALRDAMRAFTFFRDRLSDALQADGVTVGAEELHLQRRIQTFMDEVLMAMVLAYNCPDSSHR